jgi:hypothetical protein
MDYFLLPLLGTPWGCRANTEASAAPRLKTQTAAGD